ncbi:MAG TPA: response regulator [Rhodopila sp.]|jgi:two-component system response regulator FixJ|nr:response regulator [Rhodopila sp.]
MNRTDEPESQLPEKPHVIHIVDDDEAVRHALTLLIRSVQLKAVSYASGLEFLECVENLECEDIGCVLMDLRMPGLDGIGVLHSLRQRNFRRPVIVMTAHGDIETAVKAMKAGAVDFLVKPFDDEQLLEALKAALSMKQDDGDADPASRADPEPESADAARRIAELSQREREVLKLLAAGKPNKLVAYELGISNRTAEIHRARMMARLKVRSLAEAVRLAIKAEQRTPPPAN